MNKLNFCSNSRIKIFRKDFSSLNEEAVLNNFASIQWQRVFSETQNVNQVFEVFFLSAQAMIVNKHLPRRKLSRRKMKYNSKPWMRH